MGRHATIVTTATLVLVLVLAGAGQVAAATIYGIIQADKQPVANTPVSVACPGAEGRTTTDGRGTYRLTVARTGRCTLQVRGAAAQVILYEEPTRYDFELVGAGAQARLTRR
jgi:hypothetical protein